eukprot:TRINITY_DN45867_c0_g1_i1.p1 TRINITY_DN45867_c0_g1~~TRINITY_DN45867_c0_g1_i1.p1  ORF type:complete len:353 (+),score=2.98 TRINITY_DN45867_c0_g1_i1:55-1113(+)
MSFITEQEANSLRLARISLHIVGGDEDFAPQAELPVEHDDFLVGLLREIAADSVYRFAKISTTCETIEAIARRAISFEAGAQALAADFCRFHKGQARDGAFFVFELGVADDDVNIYALVKYDYSQALELIQREGVTGLRRIVEAFVSNKSAIQKAALVRTRDGVAEAEISTRDRMGRPSPMLTDFFSNYLQVERTRSDKELTVEVRDLVRTALSDNREYLPEGQLAECVAKAVDVLRSAEQVNEAVLKQAVWVGAGQPDDATVRGKLDTSVDRLVRRKKLSGLEFVPQRGALPRSVRRSIQTLEGVVIEYNTALEGHAVRREDGPDGTTRFVVTTRKYTDGVLAERAGRTSG